STTSQGSLGTQSHTYADNTPGGYTVTVSAIDKDHETGSKPVAVAVDNGARERLEAVQRRRAQRGAFGERPGESALLGGHFDQLRSRLVLGSGRERRSVVGRCGLGGPRPHHAV